MLDGASNLWPLLGFRLNGSPLLTSDGCQQIDHTGNGQADGPQDGGQEEACRHRQQEVEGSPDVVIPGEGPEKLHHRGQVLLSTSLHGGPLFPLSPGILQQTDEHTCSDRVGAEIPLCETSSSSHDAPSDENQARRQRLFVGPHGPLDLPHDEDPAHTQQPGPTSHVDNFLDGALVLEVDERDQDDEEARREMARILKELKQKHPEKEIEQLIELANYQVLSQQQKSRAFYRIQATRLMTGAGNILKRHAADQARKAVSMHEVNMEMAENDPVSKIFFEQGTYQCLENCGTVALTIMRRGGDLSTTVFVDFRTEDGTANAGSDYEFTEGTVIFKPGETQKEIRVGIIDDDIFEEDENFLVHLSNVRVSSDVSEDGILESNHASSIACLGSPSTATITIFDDDHAGIFTFEEPVTHVSESIGIMEVKVLRTSGARGNVIIPYKTIEGTARGGGEDFEDTCGELEFQNDEIVKIITIRIFDREEYEKECSFSLVLEEPKWLRRGLKGGFTLTEEYDDKQPLTSKEEEERRIAEMGRPILGEHTKLEVIIEESYEFKSTVDKLIKKTNLALVVGTNSWREQFIEAITVSAGEDDDDDECGEEKLPSCFDYVMHFLTVFWKVLFAFVPPTEYWNGWACFIVSILMIGLLTAFIGDLASHFGCTIGLKDSVTAVVFVALGTSVPDTFASKVAATQDQYADASIGNVTGSNAVNVFLGIGVAWSIAAIYHAANGEQFKVSPGTLAFSVTLFTIFAFINVGVLLYRRRPEIGGELGGPRTAKLLTSSLFVLLWLLYIFFSSLEAYCHIKGF